jgi:hypothetical protein
VLTALGHAEELRLHIQAALNVGCTAGEVAEAIFQTLTYAGVPAVNQALKVLRAILQEKGIWPPDEGREMEGFCRPTFTVESDHPEIVQMAAREADPASTPEECAGSLFAFVRDAVAWSPQAVPLDLESYRASHILAQGRGSSVQKAVLLAAMLRASGIAARLVFAGITAHGPDRGSSHPPGPLKEVSACPRP